MKRVEETIKISELEEMSKRMFGGMVKAVVDVSKEIMIVDAAMHADQEAELLRSGSEQEHLWGINLYPDLYDDEDFVEFDSMINIRPMQGNTSRSVESPQIQAKIKKIVAKRITD